MAVKKLKVHKDKKYTLSLTSREEWHPSAAMYQDQHNFHYYLIERQLSLNMKFDYYLADLVLIDIERSPSFDDRAGRGDKEKSKKRTEKLLRDSYSNLDGVLPRIFEGMVEGNLLDNLWGFYNSSDKVPGNYVTDSNSVIVLSQQFISDTQKIKRLSGSIERGRKRLGETLTKKIRELKRVSPATIYDSWRGFEETLLGAHQQTSGLVGKAQQIHDLIQSYPSKMNENQTRNFCGRVRKKVRVGLSDIVDGLSLSEADLMIWKRRFGIK